MKYFLKEAIKERATKLRKICTLIAKWWRYAAHIGACRTDFIVCADSIYTIPMP